jgi:hypothetical protein
MRVNFEPNLGRRWDLGIIEAKTVLRCGLPDFVALAQQDEVNVEMFDKNVARGEKFFFDLCFGSNIILAFKTLMQL